MNDKNISYNTFDSDKYCKDYPELNLLNKKEAYNHWVTNMKNMGKYKAICINKLCINDKLHNNKISFITLVFNNKEYLNDSMSSLIKQTCDKWECIIINDGSNYDINLSDFLSNEYIEIYKHKFKIINNKEWKGIIKCHIIGLFHASNEIIAILDCDDYLANNTVEKIVNVYDNHLYDNIFVYSNFYYCDNNLNIINNGYASHVKNLLSERRGNHLRTFKKKYYFLTKGYDDDLIFGAEDQDILFKIEEFCTPVHIEDKLYYYRTNNTTNSISCMKKASLYCYNLCILKNIFNRYKNLNFYVKIYDSINDIHHIKKYNKWKYSYINNNIKYFADLESNGIFISTLYKNVQKFIDTYINKQIKTFDINIQWDSDNNTFEVSDNIFNLNAFRLIHPNSYFDKIYIINLKKDINRKIRIETIFSKYNIKCQFIEAIYGKDEPYYSEWTQTKLKTCGVYGYSKSIINIFNDAKKNNYNKILICDDDIILINNFLIEFDKSVKSIPYNWKVLFFGLSGPWSFNINTFIYHYKYNKPYTTNLIGCDGSFCVGYDKQMFDKIIEITELFELPFDTQLIKYLNDNIHIEKYAFYPHLVIADTTKLSAIVNYQEEMNVMQNYKRNHYKFCVNLDNYDLDSMENNVYSELKIYI